MSCPTFRTAEDYRDHLPCQTCEPKVRNPAFVEARAKLVESAMGVAECRLGNRNHVDDYGHNLDNGTVALQEAALEFAAVAGRLSENDKKALKAYIDHLLFNEDGGAPGSLAREGHGVLARLVS